VRSGLAKLAILVAPLLFLQAASRSIRNTAACHKRLRRGSPASDQLDVTAHNQLAVIEPRHALRRRIAPSIWCLSRPN